MFNHLKIKSDQNFFELFLDTWLAFDMFDFVSRNFLLLFGGLLLALFLSLSVISPIRNYLVVFSNTNLDCLLWLSYL